MDSNIIQEASFNFGTFSSYIIEASILQHEDITRQMTDSGIIIINKLDNVLFDFHKKHPDIKLHLSTSNQHYSSSNTLRIEMTSKEDFICTEIPFFKLYEDWNGPKYLFTQLEAMHKELRLKGEN